MPCSGASNNTSKSINSPTSYRLVHCWQLLPMKVVSPKVALEGEQESRRQQHDNTQPPTSSRSSKQGAAAGREKREAGLYALTIHSCHKDIHEKAGEQGKRRLIRMYILQDFSRSVHWPWAPQRKRNSSGRSPSRSRRANVTARHHAVRNSGAIFARRTRSSSSQRNRQSSSTSVVVRSASAADPAAPSFAESSL